VLHQNELIGLFLFLSIVSAVYVLFGVVAVRWLLWKGGVALRPLLWDRRSVRATAAGAAILGILCILYGWKIEPYRLEVTFHEMASPKLHGLSRRVRLVHLTDIHMEDDDRYDRIGLLDEIRRLEPDLICLTGDYLNDLSAMERLRRFLEGLRAPRGVYAVLGNADDLQDSTPAFRVVPGVRLLAGEQVELEMEGSVLRIAGHEALPERSILRAFPDPFPESSFNIFLEHYPSSIPNLSRHGVDLYLCGHTHGGQVRLPFYGAVMTLDKYGKRFEAGLYRVGAMTAYVNRGLGMDPPPVRFLCRPEVAVFDFIAPPAAPRPWSSSLPAGGSLSLPWGRCRWR
jgi:predicted MPP superfamily phosphohydrolase